MFTFRNTMPAGSSGFITGLVYRMDCCQSPCVGGSPSSSNSSSHTISGSREVTPEANVESAFRALMSSQNLQTVLGKIHRNQGPESEPKSEDKARITKDYQERRRRNNDSARKSREVRRLRELQTRQKMEELERENGELQAQLALLRVEYNQLVLLLIAKNSLRPMALNSSTPLDPQHASQ